MKGMHLFYGVKPFIPRRLQISLRRCIASYRRKKCEHIWPINPEASAPPEGWRGWPHQNKFALLLSHDVDTPRGHGQCTKLMNLEKRLGFRSSFNFVLEDYFVSHDLRLDLEKNGFEVGVHGLHHDGKLFRSRKNFCKKAPRINHYLKDWGAAGFHAPSTHHNLDWLADLDIEYDSSTFDTDPFEPQPDSVDTIFPFCVTDPLNARTYVELPYTLPQDHCLFIILKERNITIWKRKLDWIAENGGMALLNTHPDYMNFDDAPCGFEQYPVQYYVNLLEYIKSKYEGQYWHPLPRELARFWRQTSSQRETAGNLAMQHVSSQKMHKDKIIGAKIWIDLDNTPHVPFFIPIIRELESRGHKVALTARDAFQVCELADKKRISYVKIGHHYGKNPFLKILGLFRRSSQLAPFYFRYKPDVALSHGSRSQILLANLVRIPSVLLMDYEHSRTIPFAHPKWEIVPEALKHEKVHTRTERVLYYSGIKEDVYIPEFKPDPYLLNKLDLPQDEIIITVRPPADEAHYRNPESDRLMLELMSRIIQTAGVRAVLLPRNRVQELVFKEGHPEWFSSNRIIIPSHVVDGLDLLWYSDLVVSGGGTMNREAAALAVPVYSIFRGKLGAVDRMLEKEGRLTMIHNADEIWTKIQFRRRDKSRLPDNQPRAALKDIVSHIEEILRNELRCAKVLS